MRSLLLHLWSITALPFSEKYADLSPDDLSRVAVELFAGRLNCSASGHEEHVLDALRHYNAVPNSCFAAGLGRVLCCTTPKASPCFQSVSEFDDNCCAEEDACLVAFEAVASKADQFSSCEEFLHCAGAIFLPCLTWTLEADRIFEDTFVPRLLLSGHRCFSLHFFSKSSSQSEPVLGEDFWLLGLCTPAACSAESIRTNAAEIMPLAERESRVCSMLEVSGCMFKPTRGKPHV
ncbi:unnamed protein product [Durusdinium trenchii]|uniref:Nose resistant-to-fluoxetine protein N-terminal domain-containing protein n=1 Tax=Durusdinium trenchii TaxID=1381693 RepID=A0ABP0M862_9DINO